MTKKYRSPTGRTAAAAAAPARLAEEYDGYAVWRDCQDGSLEVATIREGCLYRHLVHDDGRTWVIDHDPHPPGRHWAVLSYAGFGFNLLILVGLGIGQLSVTSLPLFFIGMAAVGAGALADQHATDPVRRLCRNPATAGDWHEPSRLSGWVPQTRAQLAAVSSTRSTTAFRGARCERWRRKGTNRVHTDEAPRRTRSRHAAARPDRLPPRCPVWSSFGQVDVAKRGEHRQTPQGKPPRVVGQTAKDGD